MKTLSRIVPWILILAAPPLMLHPLWTNPVSAGEDDVVYYYPLRKLVGEAIRARLFEGGEAADGTLTELMSDPQAAVMYPATWVFAALPPKTAYTLSVFAAFCLAGAGAYVYARALKLTRAAATFSSMAFMFCGFMVAHRVHLAAIHTGSYLPWGLWCIELLRRRGPAGFVAIAPVVYLGLTAGHCPTFIHVSVIWFVYFLFRARPVVRSVGLAGLAVALALAAAGPQLFATAKLLADSTRPAIGYAIAGENSFFPAAAVLFFFPMLMGSRTPNFFTQAWWGPWDLCEMLGYVGLVTLVLAGGCVWSLYRKHNSESHPASGVVRLWTWIAIGAGLWMLGYYLPTYRGIYRIPVLGLVRCPARMVLALDLALGVLAGIAIDTLIRGLGGGAAERLARSIRRGAAVCLPAVMVISLVLLGAGGAALLGVWPDKMPFPMTGGARDVLAAVRPTNPAVWVAMGVLGATVLGVRFFLSRPRRRAAALVVLLLADLFVIAWFVDVPGGNFVAPDPERSPAAEFLAKHAPSGESFRVWGLGRSYHDRPTELLLPMTCESLGFDSIATYGPFQPPASAHLLGFRIFGTNRNWAGLIRRNYLLSLYNVRYILAAEPKYREVIESVRLASTPPGADGPNLLCDRWKITGAEVRGGVLHLRSKWLWGRSGGSQRVHLRPHTIYRISLDARGPKGGAGHYLRAHIRQELYGAVDFDADPLALMVYPEQIGADWRHFAWTFKTPQQLPAPVTFRIYTPSERAVEVRNISLRESHWDRPIGLTGRDGGAEVVYRKLTELAALNNGDPPVAIYENTLCGPAGSRRIARLGPGSIELLKWRPHQVLGRSDTPIPDLARPAGVSPRGFLLAMTLPATALYVLGVVGVLAGRRRRKFTRSWKTFDRPAS